ncbi:MAG: primosomal protein N' (replication factor Y), partial [Candidatus Marinamargulisbacteria bacterium]
MKIAEVLIFRGVSQTYSYLVPEVNFDAYTVGTHVTVPFGRSSVNGVIVRLCTETEAPKALKTVLETVEKKPVLSEDMIDLIFWFSGHYQTTPHKAYQTIVGRAKLRDLPETENPKQAQDPSFSPTADQTKVIDHIINMTGFSRTLLHGVTASGKTEVYIQIAKHMIKQQKTVLMLLPEIALTPQFSEVFNERFGDTVAIIHSGLTPKYREIEWNRIYQGRVDIVIGPRSAIFVPLKNIGLVIIDEEHESSYKQDTHPRYYTHSVAEYRAKRHQAALLFGSATPRIESYTANKDTHILSLKHRVNGQDMPQVHLIDMKEEMAENRYGLISKPLIQAIAQCLEKKEKIMILINRKGFAPHIACQKCGEVYRCKQCNLSFTYHKDKSFRCHRCHVRQPITHMCPACHEPRLQFSGVGIEKVEIELTTLFPKAEILRLDRNNATTHKKLTKILNTFKTSGDILVGTQLIAKGHHIDQVTLVGVLGIDTTLNLPDFRAPERAFQLVTQVAGRA